MSVSLSLLFHLSWSFVTTMRPVLFVSFSLTLIPSFLGLLCVSCQIHAFSFAYLSLLSLSNSLYLFLSIVLAFVLCFCAFIGHLLSNSLSSSLLSLLLVFYGFCISICLLIFYSFCLQEYLFDDFVYLRIYLLLTVNTKNSINDALFLH